MAEEAITPSTRPLGPIVVHSDELTAVCGMRRMGKTTLTKALIAGAQAEGTWVYAWDLTGEYSDVCDGLQVNRPDLAQFNDVCRMMWQRGNGLLVVDECESVLGQNIRVPEYAQAIIFRGRKRGIGVLAVTHRVADMSKKFFEMCEHMFIYRLTMTSSTKRTFSDLFGDENKPWVGKIQALAPYHFLYFGAGQVRLCGPITV